jgi:putative hydrolase of the HAD superfamily
MITALLFDFNGTLIRSPQWMDLETRRLPEAALAQLALEGDLPPLDGVGLAVAQQAFRTARLRANDSGRETSHLEDLAAILTAVGQAGHVSCERTEAVVAGLHRACLDNTELLPGAVETVRQLQEMGLRLGIISNAAYPPFLGWALERFGLARAFESVVVSADVGWRKPSSEIFHLALNRLNLQPAEVVYAGDDFEKDVAAPKRLGLRAIWCRLLGQSLPTGPLASIEPDATVEALREIPEWLARWRSA